MKRAPALQQILVFEHRQNATFGADSNLEWVDFALRAEREHQGVECIWSLVVDCGVASIKLFSSYRAGLRLQEGLVTIGENLALYGGAGRVPEVSK